jgi:hypothetical protein
MALTTQLKFQLDVTPTKSFTFTDLSPRITTLYEQTLADGTAADKADRVYIARGTVADSGTPTDIDFSGSLLNPLGDAVVLVEIVTLYIRNRHATSILSVGADAAPITSFMGGTAPVIKVRPGGFICLHAPDATAYALTATTADILQIATDAGTSVPFDIVVVGRSA